MNRSFLKISATLLALILAFSCCFVFNASATGEPTISVIGNNDSPLATSDDSTTIALSGINLSDVKGMDLTLTAPAGITFSSITGSFTNNGSSQIVLVEDTNYTLTDSQIRIVATFVKKPVDSFSATISISVPDNIGKYNLPVSVTLVNSSVAKYTSGYFTNNGELIVSKTGESTNTGSVLAELLDPDTLISNNVFVPYGGVFSGSAGSYSYPLKNDDGTFQLEDGVTYSYKTFRLPTNTGSITTFSSSKKSKYKGADNNGIQFVSYALDRSKTHGTILFKGDFDALFEKLKGRFATKQIMVQACANALKDVDSAAWRKISSGGVTVLACRVDQSTAMWEDNKANGHVQYALRVLNVKPSEKFTAVGYTLDESNCYISDEYQSLTF